MITVAIVDYGMCNLDSMARAVEECGGRAIIADKPAGLTDASHIILPGVGAFGDAMDHLQERDLIAGLAGRVLNDGIPFLGVCLGMQLLATTGFEGGKRPGLGWIGGEVVRLEPHGLDTRVPHIGWNEVVSSRDSGLLDKIAPGTDFYFVHSYHLRCADQSHVVATTPYAGGFVSAIQHDNVYGVQFHPEKSQRPGFQLLRNFLSV